MVNETSPSATTLIDTPRTDDLLHLLLGIAAVKEVPSLVEHARQLERELAEARARLEIDYAWDGDGNRVPHPTGKIGEFDGIACRDETIKLLEEANTRLAATLDKPSHERKLGRGEICKSHGLAVLVTHVNDGKPCEDYLHATPSVAPTERTIAPREEPSLELRLLRDLISHWQEFGPEHGFDEKIESFYKAINPPFVTITPPASPSTLALTGRKINNDSQDTADWSAAKAIEVGLRVAEKLQTRPWIEGINLTIDQAKEVLVGLSAASAIGPKGG